VDQEPMQERKVVQDLGLGLQQFPRFSEFICAHI
jgi:hypothetical protein